MRKQFNQFKDFVHNKTLARNERQEILSPHVLQAEKHVENIRQTLTNAEKKICNSLLSGPSDSSSVTPEKKIKKLPSSSLSNCFNEASELLSSSKNDSVLGKALHLCSQLQKEASNTLTEYESEVESKCINRIQTYINEDLPSISRTRKQLNKTNSDLNTLRAKYDSALKSLQNNSSQYAISPMDGKLDALKKDLEDNQHKLGQCRDAYETEILDFLSKEMSIAQVFCEYVQLQADYHERMLAQIRHYIPVLEGVIANTTQKPVFGVALEDHLRTSGRQISLVIETCVGLLWPSMNEEGIFRVSGSVSKVKLIRNAFNSGHMDTLDLTRDTHAVASTLKSYLRELPEPLLTHKLYNEWVQAASIRDSQERLKSMWKLCNMLPEANKNNLRYLIKFLHELSRHCDHNKMSSQNLAIAIGPSLFWSSGESMELSMSNYSPILVEQLISYCDYFFPEDVIFDFPSKHKSTESISDNSDHELNLGNKQNANYRIKKPAPKPPPHSPTGEHYSTSQTHDSAGNLTVSKSHTKIRNNVNKQPNSEEQLRSNFEQPTRSDSPVSISLATVRRNNLSPRVDKTRRPISICERPVVPPPEVPPRPSVATKSGNNNEQSAETSQQSFSMFDLTERESKLSEINENDNTSLLHSEDELVDNTLNQTSLYPSLSDMHSLDHLDDVSPFTYPCHEFIDENRDSLNSESNERLTEPNLEDKSSVPQKPPRHSIAPTINGSQQDMENNKDNTKQHHTTPSIPQRSFESPHPGAPNNETSAAGSISVTGERTYL